MSFISNMPPKKIDCAPGDLLNRHLAGAIDLRRQVEQARYNIGPECASIRKLLEEVAEALDSYSQRLCERAAAFGARETGAVAGDRTRRLGTFGIANDEVEIDAIAAAIAAFGDASRSAIAEAAASGDVEACHIFTGLSHELDYDLWLLESLSRPLFAGRYWPKCLQTGISIGAGGV